MEVQAAGVRAAKVGIVSTDAVAGTMNLGLAPPPEISPTVPGGKMIVDQCALMLRGRRAKAGWPISLADKRAGSL